MYKSVTKLRRFCYHQLAHFFLTKRLRYYKVTHSNYSSDSTKRLFDFSSSLENSLVAIYVYLHSISYSPEKMRKQNVKTLKRIKKDIFLHYLSSLKKYIFKKLMVFSGNCFQISGFSGPSFQGACFIGPDLRR